MKLNFLIALLKHSQLTISPRTYLHMWMSKATGNYYLTRSSIIGLTVMRFTGMMNYLRLTLE